MYRQSKFLCFSPENEYLIIGDSQAPLNFCDIKKMHQLPFSNKSPNILGRWQPPDVNQNRQN